MGIRNVSFPQFLFVVAAFIALAPGSSVRAITFGQIDTFEDGTTQSWANGGASPPMNIASGGPAGVDDNFLQVTADGSGAGGRLTIFNHNQWLGDYIAAGVTEIDLDLKNLSTVSLSIRLAFKSAPFNGAPGYLSSAFMLNPNSDWQHAVFFITPGSMMAIGNPAAFNTFFSAPVEFRIINEQGTTDLNGDLVVAQLGIDNIAAVPEPGSFALLVLASLGIWTLRRRDC